MENNDLISEPRGNQIQVNFVRSNGNRPPSYYDNTNNTSSNGNGSLPRNSTKERKYDDHPTQMHCLTTTVPQNIASEVIAGKHTPTRNSLRHSRMIVLNKSGQAPTQPLPPLIEYYKHVKTLLILITFLGTALCTLSLVLLLWTANIRARDNPYWSAVPVIFSGIIGLIFLYFFPRKHPGKRFNYWIISMKVISIFASLIAALASFTMCAFAAIHAVALTQMTCSPPDKINTTCLCTTVSSKNSTAESYHYVDLTCTEVNDFLYVIIVFSCIINAVVGLLEIVYLFLHWLSRNVYTYSRVQTMQNLNKLNRSSR